MPKVLLASLLTLVTILAPWRLTYLGVRTLLMRPGTLHTSQATDRYWDVQRLQSRIELLGWDVTYSKDLVVYGQPVYGVTVPMSHQIVVDSTLYWNDRLSVLAHEGAHAVQPVLTAEGYECWADSVAYLVARDGALEHARYLSRHKYVCAALIATHWPEMYAAATLLGFD